MEKNKVLEIINYLEKELNNSYEMLESWTEWIDKEWNEDIKTTLEKFINKINQILFCWNINENTFEDFWDSWLEWRVKDFIETWIIKSKKKKSIIKFDNKLPLKIEGKKKTVILIFIYKYLNNKLNYLKEDNDLKNNIKRIIELITWYLIIQQINEKDNFLYKRSRDDQWQGDFKDIFENLKKSFKFSNNENELSEDDKNIYQEIIQVLEEQLKELNIDY